MSLTRISRLNSARYDVDKELSKLDEDSVPEVAPPQRTVNLPELVCCDGMLMDSRSVD